MKVKLFLAALLVLGFAVMGVSSAHSFTKQNKQLKRENIQLKSTAKEKQQLEVKHRQLEQKLDVEVKAKDVNQQKVRELQKQKTDLERQLQAKKAQKAKLASATKNTNTGAPVASGGNSGCGDNHYAHFIYMHESGCRTTALNPIGCYGIGQACPRSKIAHCGADYACQNAWFTQYANERYGGWAGAFAFWQAHRWW